METFLSNIFSIMANQEPLLAERSVEVCFVDSPAIRELNKKFFGKDQATDILAFKNSFQQATSIGELIINTEFIDTVSTEAGQYTITKSTADMSCRTAKQYDRKLAELFIHGTLHLLGFDHINSSKREIMRSKEYGYFNQVSLYYNTLSDNKVSL